MSRKKQPGNGQRRRDGQGRVSACCIRNSASLATCSSGEFFFTTVQIKNRESQMSDKAREIMQQSTPLRQRSFCKWRIVLPGPCGHTARHGRPMSLTSGGRWSPVSPPPQSRRKRVPCWRSCMKDCGTRQIWSMQGSRSRRTTLGVFFFFFFWFSLQISFSQCILVVETGWPCAPILGSGWCVKWISLKGRQTKKNHTGTSLNAQTVHRRAAALA